MSAFVVTMLGFPAGVRRSSSASSRRIVRGSRGGRRPADFQFQAGEDMSLCKNSNIGEAFLEKINAGRQ